MTSMFDDTVEDRINAGFFYSFGYCYNIVYYCLVLNELRRVLTEQLSITSNVSNSSAEAFYAEYSLLNGRKWFGNFHNNRAVLNFPDPCAIPFST